MSNINSDNQGDDNNKKLEEGLMFAEEEKIKPINQTSLFKGKSCLKKEKEKGQNKFAVKIKEPEEQKEKDNGQENNEEFKERRKRTKFKTVKEPTELKNKDLLNYGTEDNNNQNQQNNGKKFMRKGKRSTTLKEKDKLSQKLLETEMNLQVKQENLVIQEKGNPSKKYKPTKMIGSGSFGSIYESKNIIFQNVVQ